ncbi:VanW family protein [Xylanimonas ulmi]|uniref:Vancomycin resistance protein YoaR n=1 Tax=Xylanimonas ulmi TaxID=228973 RepID=A0A4Q7LZK8_9MICO|nr:VanW family protein [Xylanibacterium ulmi]RZS59847.1 vancomycin resistance protein YoaR [Xylanibacterium ulmi]
MGHSTERDLAPAPLTPRAGQGPRTPRSTAVTLALPAVPPPAAGPQAAPATEPPSATPPAAETPAAATAAGTPAEPMDGAARSRRRRRALAGVAGVAVLAGAYAGAQWLASSRVPAGTTVAGVDLGGLARDAAVTALDDALADRVGEPVELVAATASATVDPAEAGLAFDAAATVDRLTGFSLHPLRLWAHIDGHNEADPVVLVDRARLDAAALTLAERLEVEPVDGSVGFADAQAVTTAAQEGSHVAPDDAAHALASRWLVETGPLDVPAQPVPPAIGQDATDAAYAQARQIVAAPVVVEVAGQRPELPAAVLADAAAFEPAAGELVVGFDGEALHTAVVERTTGLLAAPQNAHFTFAAGRPQIAGGVPGTTLDADALATAVGAAALFEEADASGAGRTAQVDLVEQAPERTREALEALGVSEVVASFSTGVTADAVRTNNLRRGAELLTGTLVRPGETFSLLDALGPITPARGFGNAPVIVGGRLVPGLGGGLSQMATNVYNAAHFAGFEIVERQPHSVWIPRYPAGREATIFTGSIDLRFRNNTPYGAVLRSWVSGGQLHVEIWGTEHFRVESVAGPKRNIRPATVNVSTDANCAPSPVGQDGFTITNTRRVFRGSTLVSETAHTWTYRPDHGVACHPY